MANIERRGRNRWRIRVYMGIGGDGKEKMVSRTITGSAADAKQKAIEMARDRDMGGAGVELKSLTVGSLLDDL